MRVYQTDSPMKNSRRDFLRRLAALTAAAAAGVPATARLLPELLGPDRRPCGRLRIRLSDYPALQSVNGSVKVNVPDATGAVPERLIITRTATDTFAAVDDICTHAGCLVNVYQASLRALPCPCHGSLFHPTGEVIRGPATRPLRSFQTFYEAGSDFVEVEIPGYTSVPEPSTAFELTVAPNPATEFITVSGTLRESAVLSFRILSTRGQTVVEWQQWLPAGPFSLRYPLNGFAPGTYWLHVSGRSVPSVVQPFSVIR
ncbi:MAG: Rieske 2Fe-2S domain-containing protein [Bacteroidota bacterium]|nr:Rieske 2Fe-2S domain-containing protein [Bacteroidota bacterium]